MSFDRLGLAPELIRVVADQGYTEPTPVQEQAIPPVLAGRDVLAAAQTGTGKTAAFVLPILQLLTAGRPTSDAGLAQTPPADQRDGHGRHDPRNAARGPIRVLVLTPTRELALQVEESVRTYGARRPIRSTTIYGGVGFDPQVRALRAGPEIVVATPGRLLDHVEQRTIDLSTVEILVLDEADRMLDMGFIQPIRRILGLLPARRQNLLFSATFNDDIRRLAGGILVDPVSIQVAGRNTAPELVEQLIYRVDRDRKRELLSHLVRTGKIDQALVFTRTKHGANRLAGQLSGDGIAATAIHGNKSQGQRVRALDDFKAGRATVLVATDIAARGIDIESLPHVVNYELPMVPEDYIHRIGRTGRAGIDGAAISLVCVDEAALLREIETVLRHKIPTEVVEGFEPDLSIRPEAIRLRSAPGARPMGGGRSTAGRRPAPPAAWGGPPRPMGPGRPMDRPRPNRGQRHGGADRPVDPARPVNEARPINPARPAYGDRPLGGDRPMGGHRASGPAHRPAGPGGRRDDRPGAVGFGNVVRPPHRGAAPGRGPWPGSPAFGRHAGPAGTGHGPRPGPAGSGHGQGPRPEGLHGPRPAHAPDGRRGARPSFLPGERIARRAEHRPAQADRD
jgi:ATP-dependent RNA helicase RhlE